MSYARPKHEDVFIANYLRREIRALAIDTDMQELFIAYAAKEAHASPNKFKARLYHILNGRTPTAYMALLLIDFFSKKKYQGVIRKIIDYVEYVTLDGETTKLEEFVRKHPLYLRITKMKYLRDRNDHVTVVLRRRISTSENSPAL
jgi:hypothetical protein